MKDIGYISIGSNIGNRIVNIEQAILKLSSFSQIICQSSFYETQPWGYLDDANYINIVVKIKISCSPIILLRKLKNIENSMGRKENSTSTYMPRIIDLDILFFNNLVVCSDVLIIPHKELYKRNFVLKPLAEIAPNYICPMTNKKVHQLSTECQDRSRISLYKIIN